MSEIKCFLCNTDELSPAISSWCRNEDKGCKYKIIACYKCSKHIDNNMDDHHNYSCEYNSKTKKDLESKVLTKEKGIEKSEKELEKLVEEYQGEKSSFLGLQQEDKELKVRVNELENEVLEKQRKIDKFEEQLESLQLTAQIEVNPYQKK